MHIFFFVVVVSPVFIPIIPNRKSNPLNNNNKQAKQDNSTATDFPPVQLYNQLGTCIETHAKRVKKEKPADKIQVSKHLFSKSAVVEVETRANPILKK